ncbi:MAG: beta-hexosaminidase [Oscillospiraceae bacterium]|nr:beta-hexosaminidase [Oscillospiraceae bacterium]
MKRIIILIFTLTLLLCACTAMPPQIDKTIPVQSIEPLPDTATENPSETIPEPTAQQQPLSLPKIEPKVALPESNEPRTETVESILAAMTIEEKVGQLFFVRCPSSAQVEKIQKYHLGGYLLFTRDFQDSTGQWLSEEEFLAKAAAWQEASAIPLLIGVDEEGGNVIRACRNPNLFPEKRKSPQTVYRKGGMEAILQDTFDINSRLLTLGINVNFAPVADISVDPNDFIYDRTIGLDARATADYIEAVVAQMNQCRVGGQLRSIGSVLKHFPGYGNNIDTHTGIAVDERPYKTFVESDFLPFAAGIRAGAGAVLMSHNIVSCMDSALPASLSANVHRILRQELGFQGVILTDDLAMDAVKSYARDGRAAVLALLAGNSMIVTGDFEKQIDEVLTAVERGEISTQIIDSAVRYVLNWKYDLGLLGETT